MFGDTGSQTSSLVSNERQLVLQLLLTTLSGEELQVIIDLQEFDRLDEFETAVLEQLPAIGAHSTFGSELAFVHKDTGQILTNPIWDTLKDCNHFHLVVRQCFCQAEHKGQLRRIAKAIRVPPTRTGQVLPHAFTHMIDVRHVQVEAGIHTVGEAAWQHCNRLLIVHLPSTVVCLKDGVFRRCYVLHTVTAPECRYFGSWVFEECYALAQVGDQSQTGNQLAPQARFHTRAFEKCRTLQKLNFERIEHDPREVHRIIPEGCFLEAGLELLTLPADFNWMGPAACEHCIRLQAVDISQTEISEILGGTFAYCSQLQQLKLAKTVRRIGRDALLKCTSLGVIHTPPALLYINKRAFAGCTQLRKLVRVGKKGTWRGTYAEHDAFELCAKLAVPTWIRLLPKPTDGQEEWADFMRSCAEANLSAAARP